jgi:hypothetical protein
VGWDEITKACGLGRGPRADLGASQRLEVRERK